MRLTASALPRADHCIGSCVLPAIPESGGYAATGTAIDRYVQQASADRSAALAAVPDALRAYCAALPLEKIPAGCEYQVAFAYNCLTGEVRRIPSRQDGYPEMPPEWIFGSTDITGMRPGRALVWDLKWGTSTIGRDPVEDLQLGFLAMCAAKIAGVTECETGFLRADWKGDLHPDTCVLDEWALDAIEDRVRGLWHAQTVATAHYYSTPLLCDSVPPPLSVGDHCTYCPARRACPAMMQPVTMALAGRLQELAAAELPTLDDARAKVASLTLDDKGRLYERLDAAGDYLAMLRGILRDDARSEPLPLSGGKELREVQWGTRKASEAHREREKALEAEGRANGEVQTVKAAQVRPMKART